MEMIPKPPTDNIYKFMAISGLMGWFVCSYFFVSQANKLIDEVTEDQGRTIVLGERFSALTEDTIALVERLSQKSPKNALLESEIEDRLKDLSFFIGDTTKPNRGAATELAIGIMSLSRFADLSDDEMRQVTILVDRYHTLMGTSYSIGIARKKSALRFQSLKGIRFFAQVFVWAFPGISVVGFWLWWSRVQTHQDSILKKESEAIQQE